MPLQIFKKLIQRRKNMEKSKDSQKELTLPKPLEERLDYILFFRRQIKKSTHGKRTYSEYLDFVNTNSVKVKYPKSKEIGKTWVFSTGPRSKDKSDICAFDTLKLLRHAYGLDRKRVDRGHLENYIRSHEYMVPAGIALEMVDLEKVDDGKWLRKLMPSKTYEEIMKRAEMVVDIGRAIDIKEGGDGKNPFADERLDWKFRYRPISGHNFDGYAFRIVNLLRQFYRIDKIDYVNSESLAEKVGENKNPLPYDLASYVLALETVGKQQWIHNDEKKKYLLPLQAYQAVIEHCRKTYNDSFDLFVAAYKKEHEGKEPGMTRKKYLQMIYTDLREKKVKLPEKLPS